MREHQIIITLKPDQFLQVQRLARMAGAKSMGMFVRQKLLATLGIEGEPDIESQNIDLQPTISELKRLHSELRGFVAESLAMYLSDYQLGQPVANDPDPLFAAFNPNEELRTQQGATPEEDIQQQSDARQHNDTGSDNAEPEPISHANTQEADTAFDNNLEDFDEADSDLYTDVSAESPPADDDFAFEQDTEEQLHQPAMNNEPVVLAKEAPAVKPIIEPDDDFEKLADRTFAISPRLGAIEPPAPSVAARSTAPSPVLRDPLGDLLEGADDIPDEDPILLEEANEEQESMSIVEEIQEQTQPVQELTRTPFAESSIPASKEESSKSSNASQISDSSSKPISTSNTVPPNDQSTVTKPDSTAKDVQETPRPAPDAGSLGNFGGSPISGGPPPKRRKS